MDKTPYVAASGTCFQGWAEIRERLGALAGEGARIVAVECYPGVDEGAVARELAGAAAVVRTAGAFRTVDDLGRLLDPYLTEDPVFGRMCDLRMNALLDSSRLAL